MAIINATDFIKELCDAWGLNGAVRKITIELEYDNVATITVLYYMKDENISALRKLVQKYDLTPKDDSDHAKNKDCHLP